MRLPATALQFQFTYQDGVFTINTSGAASFAGFTELFQTALGHDDCMPGRPVLVNLSGLNTSRISSHEIQEIAHLHSRHRDQLGDARVAIVTDSKLVYGLARMWLAYVNTTTPNSADCIFTCRDEAINWLREN